MNRFPTLAQIVGHQAVLAGLQDHLARGRMGHAYLFHGPGGVGKATLAAALCQALFCRQGRVEGRISGCGHCPPCQRMAAGSHPDLVRVEMAADKTRIGIDQIRELAGFLALTPMEGRWKAAIVDDGAWMSEEASNALLKTLEEPPPGSLLILVSHRAGALSATIRSRCVKIRFSLLSRDEQLRLLAALTGAADDVATQAVDLAAGDMGRAVALCDPEPVALRQRFFEELEALGTGSLGDLCEKAEYWGHKDRFPAAAMLLRVWFRDAFRVSVSQQHGDGGRRPGQGWLESAVWVEQLLRRAALNNLNRRLVLEGIFIRLVRTRGASH